MAKNKPVKKLSKNQLKKLKGGLLHCSDTDCRGNTCGMADKSFDNCQADNSANTLSISEPSGGKTPIKGSK